MRPTRGTRGTGAAGHWSDPLIVGLVVGTILTAGTGLAYAYYSASGTGEGSGSTHGAVPVTLAPGSVSGSLHPGGTATVVTVATNALPVSVRIMALELDTTQGMAGFAVDSAHSGCTLSAFSFTAQTNGGAGWTVPAGGSTTISLPAAMAARATTDDACQGASVTVYLKSGTAVQDASYATIVRSTSGLLSYYRLGEDDGPTLVDDGGGANGTWTGGPTFGASGAVPGNRAVAFDGVDDYGEVARTISTALSIEFWFRSTGGGGLSTDDQWWQGAGMVDAEMPGAVDDFGVSLLADGRVVAGTGNPDTNVLSGTGFNDGAWHHVVMTRNDVTGVLQLYVDGTLRDSATGSQAPLTAPSTIRFGNLLNGDRYFEGSLDEIALYEEVLTGATVSSHYQARNS